MFGKKTNQKITDNEGISNQAGGDINTDTVNQAGRDIIHGYTIEQHQAALEERESQIRGDLERAHNAEKRLGEAELNLMQLKLEKIINEKADLQTSYDKRIAELESIVKELQFLEGSVGENLLEEALEALAHGDSSKADQLFEQVEKQEQEGIERAANAVWNRGKIAQEEYRWGDAYNYFKRAVELHANFDYYIYLISLMRVMALYEQGMFYLDVAIAKFNLDKAPNERSNLLQHEKFYFHLLLAEHDKAEEIIRDLYECARKNVSGGDKNMARILIDFSMFLNEKGDYTDAQRYAQKSVELNEKMYGEMNAETMRSYNNLAGILLDQGKYADAQNYFMKYHKVAKNIYKALHPDVAGCYNNLSVIFLEQGEYDTAQLYVNKAITIGIKIFGEMHPDIAIYLNSLGRLLQVQGHYVDAQENYEKAIGINKKLFEKSHKSTALYYNNLGTVLMDQGNYSSAHGKIKNALEIYKEMFGETHPDIAGFYHNKGLALQGQGKYKDALNDIKEAVAIGAKTLGEEHPTCKIFQKSLRILETKMGST